MQVGIGWLGLSEQAVMKMSFWAIAQGYEGRLDMIRDVLKAVFGDGKDKDGQRTSARVPPTKTNVLAIMRLAGGPFKKVPKP